MIDDQAAAVQAAEDALAAVAEDYQTGRAGAAAVISCSGQLLRPAAGLHPLGVRLQSQHRRLRPDRHAAGNHAANPGGGLDRPGAAGGRSRRGQAAVRCSRPARRSRFRRAAGLQPAQE